MDIMAEIAAALERNHVPADIRIASALDLIGSLTIPSRTNRPGALLAVEAYERGYQEALTKLRIADEAHYSEGFKAGRAMKKNDGKNAFEAGMEKGKRDTEKKHEQEINHLQLALKQAGKNYLDLRQEYTDTLEKAKKEYAAEVLKLTYKNEQALEVKWREGYREGKGHAEEQLKSLQSRCNALRGRLNKSDSLLGTIQGNYAELEKRYHNLDLNYHHSVKFEYEVRYKRGHDDGYQKGLKDGHYNGLQEAAKAVDTKILATTHKEPTLGGIPEDSQAMADASNWDMRARVMQ